MPRVGTGKAPGRRFARWTAVVGVVLIVVAPVAFWFTLFGATTSTRVVGVVAGVVAAASSMVLKAAERAGRMDRRWWPTLASLSLAAVFGSAVAVALTAGGDESIGAGFVLLICGPPTAALLIFAVLRIPPYNPPAR